MWINTCCSLWAHRLNIQIVLTDEPFILICFIKCIIILLEEVVYHGGQEHGLWSQSVGFRILALLLLSKLPSFSCFFMYSILIFTPYVKQKSIFEAGREICTLELYRNGCKEKYQVHHCQLIPAPTVKFSLFLKGPTVTLLFGN